MAMSVHILGNIEESKRQVWVFQNTEYKYVVYHGKLSWQFNMPCRALPFQIFTDGCCMELLLGTDACVRNKRVHGLLVILSFGKECVVVVRRVRWLV
jgi:hypothetical protein